MLTLLLDVVRVGIAFHHAGMEMSDRRAVEDMFREELLLVIFSTTTMFEMITIDSFPLALTLFKTKVSRSKLPLPLGRH